MRQAALQPLQHGDEPSHFFGGGNSLRSGTRGFRADIDNVSTLLLEFQGAGEGAVGVQEFSAIAEGIGGHVQYAQQQGAFAEFDFALLQFPVVELSHRASNFALLTLLVGEGAVRRGRFVRFRGAVRTLFGKTMGNPFAPKFGTFSSNENFDDIDDLGKGLDGKSVPTAAERTARDNQAAWAVKLVKDFGGRSGTGAFTGIDRGKVAAQLPVRIADPTKINQANTWLCGVTSVIRAWAQDSPVDYAWLGIQLYDTGRGRLGKGQMLGQVITPSLDLRRSPVPSGMEEADWVILASVHECLTKQFGSGVQDAFGVLGGRNYTSDEGFLHYRAWQTAQEVVAAYRATGYRNVIDNTAYTSNKGIRDLEKANDYLRQGYRVSLLINARLLEDSTIGTQGLIGSSDHWVGMLEAINVIGDYVLPFKVFSWGKQRRVPGAGERIAFKDFMKEFFGFVAARMY